MYFSYQKWEYEEYENFSNMYEIPNFVRGYIGQGIQYPSILSSELAELQIFPLNEIASMESDIARECGYEFPQKALLPGRQYRVENGNIEAGRKECQIGIIKRNASCETIDKNLINESSFPEQDFSIPLCSSRNDKNSDERLYAS